MVLLTGEVPTEADKTPAEQVVVPHRQRAVGRQRAASGSPTLDHRALRTTPSHRRKVKASFVDAKDLFANAIKVVTERGVVYLMGRVTEREADRAAEIARGVSGVSEVVKVFEII